MKLTKKIIAGCTALLLLFPALPSFALSSNEQGRLELLSSLLIMQGDADGDLRLDDPVSRAEFAKIAVASSNYRNSVALNLTIAPFKDVSHQYWGAPYIKTAVSSKLCTGYPDGSFRPDDQVLYEEAVTMLLKVLGYTDEDFGVSWPYGQVGLASNLEITEGVGRSIGEPLTRRDSARLVYNLLDTKMKGSQQKLITIFDAALTEDVTLIATSTEDPSVNAGKVFTSAGSFNIPETFNHDLVGRKGDLAVKNGDTYLSFTPYDQETHRYSVTDVIGNDLLLNGDILDLDENELVYYKSQKMTYKDLAGVAKEGDSFVLYSNASGAHEYGMLLSGSGIKPDKNTLEKHVVYSALSSGVVTYKDGVMDQLDIEDSTDAYEKDSKKTTYGAMKGKLEMGDLIYVKRDKNNRIEYVSIESGNMQGPVTVHSDNWMDAFDTEAQNVSVMRNGSKVSISAVKPNDVVYYSRDLKMLLAYNNKVTGVYEKATPNKDTVTSVVVSGKTYQLEGVSAFQALSSNGPFEFGDTITLLLGKDQEVADAISAGATDETLFGYLYQTGKKEFTKSDNSVYSSYYADIVLADGNIRQYTADRDYSNSRNKLVRVDFKDGTAKLSPQNNHNSLTGDFKWSSKKLGDMKLSSDLRILDVTSPGKDEQGHFAAVFPQRIDGVTLKTDNILLYDKNEKNEITTLFLNDATGDAHEYGIMTKAQNVSAGMVVAGQYTFDIGGQTYSYASSNTSFNVRAGQPMKFSLNGSKIEEIEKLEKLDADIKSVTPQAVTAGGKTYPLSDHAYAYLKKGDLYTLIPVSELAGNDSYTVEAYYDKPIERGGRIRILTATKTVN